MNIEEFIKELEILGIKLDEVKLKQLNMYYTILVEENKYMNLTGITEENDVYLKHFFDSLTMYKVIDLNKELSLVDVGTGAGFPGLVLKIVFPNLKVTLVDSLAKRTNFLEKVINELELENIEVITSRAEEYSKVVREKFDIVTSRAVAKLNILLEYSIPLLKVGGSFIPLKANVTNEELELKKCLKELDTKFIKKEEFKLPIEDSNRTILVYKKLKETKMKYPRTYDKIKKNGL